MFKYIYTHIGDSEAIIQCSSFLRDIVLLDEFPRPESRDRAIMEVHCIYFHNIKSKIYVIMCIVYINIYIPIYSYI